MAGHNNASTAMVAYVEQRFPRRLPTFQLHLFMMKCSERILTCHLLDRMAFVLFGNADQPLLLTGSVSGTALCSASHLTRLSLFSAHSSVCLPLHLSPGTLPRFALHFLAVLPLPPPSVFFSRSSLFPPHSFIFPPHLLHFLSIL